MSAPNTQLRRAVVRALVDAPLIVHVLRIILCISVHSIELATFWPYTKRCRSRLPPEARSAPIQLLILTDPQIITGDPHPSYPGLLAKIFFPLARTFTDRYLYRAWRALRTPGQGVKDWTATVWMGDLTDTGRDFYLQEGLPELYDRFFSLFPAENKGNAWNRTFYLPGNHDISIQAPPSWHDPPFNAYWLLQGREYTRVKFLHLFGTTVQDLSWDATPILPPTSLSHTLMKPDPDGLARYTTKKDHFPRKSFSARVPIKVAHADGSPPSTIAEVILLDAVDVVSLQRMGRSPWTQPPDGKPGSEADWRIGGSWWFAEDMAASHDPSIPRILFSHIPLHRDPNEDVTASCQLPDVATFPPGVLPASNPSTPPLTRQSSRPIQMGTDAKGTYENMIGPEWSRFIKERIQPSVIFSGDDHDYCHHLHSSSSGSSGSAASIPELTVPALSLTSGVRTPGYARLAIWQEPVSAATAKTRISYTACALPPQIEFWSQMYPLIVALTAVILFARRVATRRRATGGVASHASSSKKRSVAALLPRWAKRATSTSDHDIESRRAESVPLHVIGGDDGDDDENDDGNGRGKADRQRQRSGSDSRPRSRSRSRSRSPSRTGRKASPFTSPAIGGRLALSGTDATTNHNVDDSVRSRRTLTRAFLLDCFTVMWVPAVYWMLLWLFGF